MIRGKVEVSKWYRGKVWTHEGGGWRCCTASGEIVNGECTIRVLNRRFVYKERIVGVAFPKGALG